MTPKFDKRAQQLNLPLGPIEKVEIGDEGKRRVPPHIAKAWFDAIRDEINKPKCPICDKSAKQGDFITKKRQEEDKIRFDAIRRAIDGV